MGSKEVENGSVDILSGSMAVIFSASFAWDDCSSGASYLRTTIQMADWNPRENKWLMK